jgi:hypothetical protein
LPWQRIRFSPAFSSLLVLNSFAHMLSLTHFSPSAELLGPSFPCFADYFLTGRPQKPTYLSFFLFFLSNRYIPAKFLLTSHTHTHFRPTCLLTYWHLRSTHVLKPYLQPTSIALCLACQRALLLVQFPLFNESVLEFSHFYSLLLLRVGLPTELVGPSLIL